MLKTLLDICSTPVDEQTTFNSSPLLEKDQPVALPWTVIPLSSLKLRHVKLGVGGEATVEAGNWDDNGTVRPVAIKIFGNESVYETERSIHKHLSKNPPHPHVIRAYGCARSENQIIVTELLNKMTLGDWLCIYKRNSETQIKKAYDFVLNTLQGLIYLHSLGVLHLDLKPDNILLTANETAKIIDFGCAELLPEGKDEVTVDEYKGTPRYMSPEMANRTLVVSRLSDIYPMGAIILLCASINGTKIYPNIHGNDVQLSNKIASNQLTDIPSYLMENTKKLILHCFEFNKKMRPSAQEVHDRLLEIAYPKPV